MQIYIRVEVPYEFFKRQQTLSTIWNRIPHGHLLTHCVRRRISRAFDSFEVVFNREEAAKFNHCALTMEILLILTLLDASLAFIYLQEHLHSHSEDHNRTHELLNCVTLAMGQLFKPGNPITIVAPKDSLHHYEEDEVFQKLAKHAVMRIYREYKHRSQEEKSLERISKFLVFSMTQDQLENDFNQGLYNIATKFLVVTNASANWLQSFTNRLNRSGYKRIAFLLQHSSENNTVHSADKNEPRHIISCKELLRRLTHIQYLQNDKTIFKYARVLNQNVTTVCNKNGKEREPPSLSGDILRLLSEKFSITMKRQEVNCWKIAINLLKRGEISMIYSTHPEHINDLEELEVLTWVKFGIVNVVDRVRNTSLLSAFRMLKPFQPAVWHLTISAFFMTIVFAFSLNKLRAGGPSREFLRLHFICAIALSQAAPRLPTKVGLRFYVGMWLFAVYIMTTGYNATYRSFIISANSETYLKTFYDVIESKRSIAGREGYINVLRNSSEPNLLIMAHRCKNMSSKDALNVVLESNWLGLLRTETVQISNWKNRGNKSRQLYMLHDTLITYPLIFIMRKNSMRSAAFRKTIHTSREMGILQKLEKDNNRSKLRSEDSHLIVDEMEDNTIKLVHLTRFLEVIFVSYLIATIVFILEILIHRFKRRV